MENPKLTIKIPQHRHCQVCGKAIKAKDEMCSDQCKTDWDKTVKRKRFWLMAYGVSAAMLVLILALAWR